MFPYYKLRGSDTAFAPILACQNARRRPPANPIKQSLFSKNDHVHVGLDYRGHQALPHLLHQT